MNIILLLHIISLQKRIFCIFIFALKVLINTVLNVDCELLAVYRKSCWSRDTRTGAAELAAGNAYKQLTEKCEFVCETGNPSTVYEQSSKWKKESCKRAVQQTYFRLS